MRKNYWKYIIIALLAGIAVFHFSAIAMIWGNQYELTATDYYEQEANHEIMRAQIRAGAPYQWQVTLSEGRAALRVLGSDGQAVAITNPRLELYKPNDAGADRFFQLSADDAGWRAETGPLAPGLWRLTVLAEYEGQTLAYKTSTSL